MRADRESEPRVFTEYIRALDPRGEPPGEEAFRQLWHTLRTALRSELKKRGLWESPPSYLGIAHGERWEGSAPRLPARGGEAEGFDPLDELVEDCYLFIFVERLRSLQVQLRRKPNVDGLVFLNIRHFLHERRRRHDPVGFRVFQVLHAAAERAVKRGELGVLAGDPRVRNDTVLGWRLPSAPLPPVDGHAWAAAAIDGLLPDLIEAKGRALEGVLEPLRERLVALGASGAEAFVFKELVDPLKGLVRSWNAARLGSPGEAPAPESPESLWADAESFAKLTACIEERLARLPLDPRSRRYLDTLWGHLKSQADDEVEGFSQRRLAEKLQIPRDRLPELYARVRGAAVECRAANRFPTPLQGDQNEDS